MRVRLALISAAVVGAATLAAATQAAGPAGDAKAGEALFKSRCLMCHSAGPGKPAVLAPDLHGVGGRKAASTAFAGYSSALKASGLTWTKANLDTFLTSPGKMVPGTKMVIAVPAPKDRADVVAYLSSLK